MIVYVCNGCRNPIIDATVFNYKHGLLHLDHAIRRGEESRRERGEGYGLFTPEANTLSATPRY